ncbi:aspartyl-phosphate phosphatase Spo0E family protein [Clostridium rectalis]|uniref:aspartyl-phosphate phosphatase Spo0E family protein n=1 Tax=Clostridium rectalis TaxID=2040295 RepID=UPI0013DE438E|nr:aspartyl-phosphate phosphatase Spo0E family protein [Clostridium rectalis]
MNSSNLLFKIESLRSYLHSLVAHNNLTDLKVVDCSQKLDKLLTEYEKIKG